MKKIPIYPILILAALLICGLYGVVHDQITYTISPEYYTRFKFIQFGLVESGMPERLKVAVVGFLASWWMGFPIGIVLGLVGFIHPDPIRMYQVTMRSFYLAAGVTLVVGLAGLGLGYVATGNIQPADYAGWAIPPNLANLRGFLCVGYIHLGSYAGGMAAIPIAGIYQFLMWRKNRQAMPDSSSPQGKKPSKIRANSKKS